MVNEGSAEAASTTVHPDKLYEQANELLINDDFDDAVQLFTQAIEVYDRLTDFSKCYNCYLGRSQAYLKLNKPQDALNDAQSALDMGKTDSRGYLRKGMAMFKLKNYVDALGTLQKGQSLVDADCSATTTKNLFADWIAKCNQEIAKSAPVAQPTFKHEWYQTESHVVVSILAKNFTAKDVNITTNERDLIVESANPDIMLNFKFHLFLPIRHDETQIKYLANKIEIKLKKTEAVQWLRLEAKPNEVINQPLPVLTSTAAAHKPSYPSSSKHAKNWDQIESEINKEDKEGLLDNEDALNKLFKQVYANGSDETRKAMNKSFLESGGTVLSTNWKDIGKDTTEIKAPDGMEWKKWDQ